MSADPDKDTACPQADTVIVGTGLDEGDFGQEVSEKKRKKPSRSVRFPDEDQLVTKYFEAANPWHDVPNTTRAQLAAEYLESCRRHNTAPIDSVLLQIRELPENCIGCGNRAARLTLASCSLAGAAPADALEAVLRKVQFRRIEIQYCELDDEGAEALFDMIEYYESATVVSISGPRQFGIRGWQAACRMIKKSAELSELSLCESALCASHAPVLVRALRLHTCHLRALCLQRAELRGEPLLCLVIALKSNTSIRELRLPDNQLTVSDAQQLASLLKLNLHIQLLDLSNNDIQDAGTGHIADALVEQAAQTPPSVATSPLSPMHCAPGGQTRLGLAFLVLWNNQLTRNCAPHLTKALQSSQSLCVLNIGRNALGADTVRALQCGGALVSLGLQCARLGPAAARPLAHLLRQDTKLQRLDLRDNRLGVAGLQAILEAMQENTTLTQIDLDDPEESATLSAEESEMATIARLTRDIGALCRRNEPPATEPERRVHRKISLTCHTAASVKPSGRCAEAGRSRTVRLRSPAPSPAPSPAGSPVPHAHNSRFNVTRVTPERDSSTESPSPVLTRAPYCLTPSRFKVVQVAEPPQIQIHPATQKRPSSRFSVTRNYDAMYNPSSPSPSPTPSAGSPSPSVSPVPSASPVLSSPTPVVDISTMVTGSATVVTGSPAMTTGSTTVVTGSPTVVTGSTTVLMGSTTVLTGSAGSPTVMTGSSTVMTGSPTVVKGLPTAMTGPPAVVTGLPAVVTGSTTVLAGLPTMMTGSSTVMTGSPTVLKGLPTVITGPPAVVSGLPVVVTGSTTVLAGSPTVMMESPTVMTGSPIVMTGSSTVMTGSPTVVKGLPTVMKGSHTVVTGSPTVVTGSPAISTSSLAIAVSSAVMTGSPSGTSGLPTATDSRTAITGLHSVLTGSPQVFSEPILTSISATCNVPTSLTATCNVPNTTLLSNDYATTAIVVSPQTVGVMTTTPITAILTNVKSTPLVNVTPMTETCVVIGPINQGLQLTSMSSVSIDTISASTFVTSGIESSISQSPTVVPVVSSIETVGTEHTVSDKAFGTNTFDASSDDVIQTITGDVIKNAVEDVFENSELRDNISTVKSEASIDTLVGPIVTGTSLDTLNGKQSVILTDDACRDLETMESLVKVTDFLPNLSNIGALSIFTNTDISQPERRFGRTAIPKNVVETKIVPNSRFSISPIPDNFDMLLEDDKLRNISKPVAIVSRSNVAATDSKTAITEADVLTMLAEITEKVEPKVFEPKYLSDVIDLDEHKYESMPTSGIIISECKAMVNEENIPITICTDVSGPLEESTADKQVSEMLQDTIPIENILNPTEASAPFKIKDDSLCIDIRSIPAAGKLCEIAKPLKEYVVNKQIYNMDAKSIPKDEMRQIETNIPIAKEAVTEFDGASKLKESESDKMRETKTTESVKNKTYSDVVKSDPKYLDKSEQLTHKEEISDSVVKTETRLVKNSVEVSDSDKLDVQIEVTVKKESVQDAKVHIDQNKEFVSLDDIITKKEPRTMKQIEEITEDLGNLIQEMKDMSSKSRKLKSDCTVDIVSIETNKVPGNFNRDVVLKKNKSESSLDSPDLEVSRLMNKKLVGSPFCDSSSSLEVSGSSMESLNATENQYVTCHVIPKQVVIQESVESDTELDRRKDIALSMGSSIESASDVTPVNSGNYLNMSVSSNESVSPIIFGKKRKIHDSLSSLEASMSSLDSGKQEKVMVTSADSGIEYSLQQPSENKEDNSSNEGTLTHNSSLKETVKKTDQETLTSSPKRASSLLDVPALKTKGLDRMRKISWVAPSSSFHIPRVETEKLEKPSHLEKLLSLFQHPTSLFSRSQSDEEKKSASNTPPRKDSSLTSSFWSWGSTIDKDDKEDSSEATDSTLSERVQVSFVDESFSKKLDSKTPSTDTDNTLSEFQSFPTPANADNVTADTTDEQLVQKCLDLSLTDKAGSNGNSQRVSDTTDLSKPNDLNRNYDVSEINEEKSENKVVIDKDEARIEAIRPRSFAAVLKSSGSENSLEKQPSPESGQPVDKLPSKVIRGIKENISPENTLTSSMTNTKTLALELTEKQTKSIVNTVWEVPILDKSDIKTYEVKTHSDLAPIATIDETCDEAADDTVNVKLEFIDDVKTDNTDVVDIDGLNKEMNFKMNVERGNDIKRDTILETDEGIEVTKDLGNVDLGKDALSYLIYESQVLETDTEHTVSTQIEGSLAQELKDAEIKEMLDLSPELIIDEALEPELFTKEIKAMKSSPGIPERAKLKKSNSLEGLSQIEDAKISPKTKTIAFKIPETQPRDIPRTKLRTLSGSSPKSLPESLNKQCPLVKLDPSLKKRKKVSSLGKIAKDSLLALNMSEEEIAEYRRSYVTSVESLRSLESVSEDANSQSGTSVDSRCRFCLRMSQESLMSLDSITEDCKCGSECEKNRSVR